MAKTAHTHKLKRLRYKSGNEIFFCCLPDCSFKTNIALALGKRSICWRCGEQFIMNEYSLRLAKPHCDNCHKPKNLPEAVPVVLQHEELPERQVEVCENIIVDNHSHLSLMDRLNLAIQSAKQPIQEDEEI